MKKIRRSAAEIEAAGRYASGRPRPKGVTSPKPPKLFAPRPAGNGMRAEWFVNAGRNGCEVRLAAPEGEREARAMTASLIRYGWEARAYIANTYRTDPRFHELSTK